MRIAILTFEGFNELDSFIASGILNRMARCGWEVAITSPTHSVTSMNGVRIHSQQRLEFANEADVVLVGSGIHTRDVVRDVGIMGGLDLDPSRQLIGSQCSGALVLAKLGLLDQIPTCTDLTTRPWVLDAGVEVIGRPFHASGNVATAGGCLSSVYLAAWVIARVGGLGACADALRYVAPVGEKDSYVEHALRVLAPYLEAESASHVLAQ
ncbi:DJ-1/PfpI family protein [Pseudomonas sp. Marseille-QA0892]